MNLTKEKTGELKKYETAIFALIATVVQIITSFLLVKLASVMFGIQVDGGAVFFVSFCIFMLVFMLAVAIGNMK